MGITRNRPMIVGVLLAVAILISLVPPDGARGSKQSLLDPTFGLGGRTLLEPPQEAESSEFTALARRPDGRLLLEVRQVRALEGRELEMRLPDGGLDPSFGKEGRLPVGEGSDVVALPDGDILVAVDRCGGKEGSVMMLDADGTPVRSFGRDGCGGSVGFRGQGVTTDPQGRILVGGTNGYCPCDKNGGSQEVVVARLLADGHVDREFGTDGRVGTHTDIDATFDDPYNHLTLEGLASTADGGILISTGGGAVRLEPDGALDATFGTGGVVKGPPDYYSGPVIVQPDGTVELLSAEILDDALDVSKFGPDGAVETGFGEGGTARIPVPSDWYAFATTAAAAPEGGILIASREPDTRGVAKTRGEVFLVRLTASGQPDQTYGEGGVVKLGVPVSGAPILSGLGGISVEDDGSALPAGVDLDKDAVLVSRTGSGAPDPAFGEGGTLSERREKPAQLATTGLALDPQGSPFVLGAPSYQRGAASYLARLTRDGEQIPGPEGQAATAVGAHGALVPIKDGFVVWDEDGSRRTHLIHAIGFDGAPLASFGDEGTVRFPAGLRLQRIEATPDGGCILVGSGRGRSMAAYRLGPDGSPLAGFGRHGQAALSFDRDRAIAFDAVVEADGDTVLTGWFGGGFAAARLRPDGKLDQSFGRRGLVRNLPGIEGYGLSIASLPSGGVVIGTIHEPKNQTKSTGLVRLDRHGHPVPGFGHGGQVRIPSGYRPRALLVAGGTIVTVDNPEPSVGRGRGGAEVRVFRADGSLDHGFSGDGLAILGRGGGSKPTFTPTAAAVQSDDEIVIAGTSRPDARHSAAELLRFRLH